MTTKVKAVWQSKTMWVNAITTIVALLSTLMGQEFVSAHPSMVSALVMVIGILNVILRWVTDKPVTLTGAPSANGARYGS